VVPKRLGNSILLRSQTSFFALESSSNSEGINRVWENTKEYIKNSAKGSLGPCKLKQHKLWFDEYFQDFKQAKMQWLRDPNQNNLYNLNNFRNISKTQRRNTES
jgi:hypothetical protein